MKQYENKLKEDKQGQKVHLLFYMKVDFDWNLPPIYDNWNDDGNQISKGFCIYASRYMWIYLEEISKQWVWFNQSHWGEHLIPAENI